MGQTELLCEVCGDGPAEPEGMVLPDGIEVTVWKCDRCRRARVHPYGRLVSNTAWWPGTQALPTWWTDLIFRTRNHLHKDEDEFWDDVAAVRHTIEKGEGSGVA